MQRVMRGLKLFALALGVGALWHRPVLFAQDLAMVAPDYSKVLLENERVRVLESTVPRGEKLPMHSHSAAGKLEKR